MSQIGLSVTQSSVAIGRQAPMNVVVVSHNLCFEGASISLKELVLGLMHCGAVTPAIMSFEDGPLRAEYESHGIAVQVLPGILDKISTRRRLGIEVKRLALHIQESGAELVFVNTLLNFPAILAAERAGVPSIWNPRESEPWDRYFEFLPVPIAQTAISAIGLPRRVVFVADATLAVWRDFETLGNFTVIHNALNVDRFSAELASEKAPLRVALGWSKDEVVFLCVGTVCDRKGQADVLGAIEQIASGFPCAIRIVFAGDARGHYAMRLRRNAAKLHGKPGVHFDFVPATSSIGQYYRAADVFLLCSRVESYPRVVLEAIAFGLPIISTPVFGVIEQLPDPSDACFYEPGDTNQLSAHMLRLAGDPKAREFYSNRTVARFASMGTFDDMLSRYEEVIRSAATSTACSTVDTIDQQQ